ncbi:hypothetical protein DPE35_19125 [Salmonella enterica subsp. enterica serovar Woodinville]|nr:hypothetical protein [Salmonella enterica]EBS3975529.1 hypothetical protein [Salmonella enterica subsp. enterica serovar Woodinville]
MYSDYRFIQNCDEAFFYALYSQPHPRVFTKALQLISFLYLNSWQIMNTGSSAKSCNVARKLVY